MPPRLFAYDIFKKQFKKYSIVVKLTDRYEITELASYISCPSPSTPLFPVNYVENIIELLI